MEENNSTELEEGEACYYREEEGGNNNIDPDIALSYIDEKIQYVLGHFQKDFEGGVTAENLGAKFGGYGSFLPTYERSPSSLSRQRSPERSSTSAKSQNNNLSAEGVPWNLRAPDTAPRSSRPKAAQCNVDKLHNAKFPSGDLSIKQVNQEPEFCSNPIAENPTRVGTLIKSGKGAYQRPLKVRIKMRSDNNTKTNSALYNGLGLEGSPSTSLSSSSQESGGFPLLPVETTGESPTYILQVMTSFPVPCSDLASPLNESLLSLIKGVVVRKDNKPAENVKVSSEKNTVSVDQLVTVQGDVTLSKLKRIKSESRDKSPVEMNNGNSMFLDNKMTILVKQEIKNQMLDDDVSLHYNSEKASLFSTGDICGEPRKIAAKASEVIGEANNVKVRRKDTSNSVKESPLRPMSGSDYDTEVKKRQKITIVKAGEHGVSTSQVAAAPFDSMENGMGQGDSVAALPKDRRHVAKNKKECVTGEADCLKLKIGHEAPRHEKSDTGFPFRDEKPLIGGKKKARGSQSDDKAIFSGKDRLRIVAGNAGKDKKTYSHDIPPSKKKVLTPMSGKDVAGLGNGVDASGSSNGGWSHLEAPSARRQRDASSTFPVVENDSVLPDSRVININGVSSSSFTGAHVKGAVDAAAGAPTSETVPAAASLLENWVGCDLCEKWRLLPNGIKPEDLPKKWMCSMLVWLPGMNSCDIHEDVTTGIMRGLIPFRGFESQDHANGSTFGVSSVQHLGQNPPNVSTVATDGRGKSKLGQKEMLKKNKGVPVKSRSLNNMSPPPAGWNSLRRCNLPESTSQDLALGEDIPKQKENLNIGDKKLIKEKSKRNSDQFEFETSKRAKRDEISNGAKLGNSDIEVCSKGLSLGTPKLTLVKSKGHSGECGSAKEVKHGLGDRLRVSVKNLSDQSKVSTDCTSMDLKESSSLKKRKLKGSQENHIDSEPYHRSAQDSKLMAEEGTDHCILRKGKKSRFLDTVIRDTRSGDGNSKPKKEVKAIRDLSFEIRKCFNDGVEEDQHPSKNRKQLAPKQAASSSSVVSGSRKSRVNFEVQGSPVESVSSSPMRITNSAKFSSVGHDVLTSGDAPNGVLPVVDNVGTGSNDKVKNGGKLFGIVMKKDPCGFHSGSLESGCLQKDAKPFYGFRNGHILEKTTDYPQHGEFPVNHTSHDNGVHMKSGTALCLQKNGNTSFLSNVKGRNSASDSDRDKVKALETASEKVAEHRNKRKGCESLVKANHAPPFCEVQSHVNPDPAENNVKNHTRRDLSKQNKHAQSDGRIVNHYSDFGLESPSENTCTDSNCRVEAAQMSAESMSSKEILFLHPGDGGKQGAPSRDSQIVGQRNICNGLSVDTAGYSGLSKALLRNKKNAASNVECLTSEMDVKDTLSSNPTRANRSVETACTVLKEAEKLRDLADRLKGTNFGFEGNESYFEAAVKFLQGASLLESGNGESSKHREMTPFQVHSTAAKLFESCATEFERCQELAAAALAYKCMEVAYMRVVNCKYVSLSRDRHELQATLQGESPSSSASDIDNLNNQAVADRSNLSKGAGSHAVGNHIVARNCSSFVRLLDFTQDVNFAMEASRKSQVAFLAANGIMKESQNKEHIMTSLKKVIDFSFQDIDGLVHLVQLARKAISRSGFSGAKD